MQGTVAVTGATGFIGNVFLESLLAQGWQVKALARRPQPANPGLQWVAGDLHDIDALNELVNGATAVIHCAGTVRGRSQSQFDDINAKGTANLVNICVKQGQVPRFLLISSLAARHPEVSWYASSKLKAEVLLDELAGSMPWAVFRPTAVYGPGDRELMPLFDVMKRYGLLPMPGFTPTRFSLIHVADIASAVMAWISSENPVTGVFELADDRSEGYDRHALAALAQKAWNRTVKPVSIPAFLVFFAAYLNLGLAKLFRYSPMLTPGKVRELIYPDWLCDNTPLKQSLPGWHPRITLQDALPELL